jgi:hypothetical protein
MGVDSVIESISRVTKMMSVKAFWNQSEHVDREPEIRNLLIALAVFCLVVAVYLVEHWILLGIS